MSRVAFVGMTHLGLNHAVAAAERGCEVLCLDTSADLIEELEHGRYPVEEPGLAAAFSRNASRIRFTAEAQALAGWPLVYVAPDVPTDDTGGSDLSRIRELIALVSRFASPDVVAVILSQVPPGFTRAVAAGQVREPVSLQWFYQVETLIFGQALRRALEPERFIVGCGDPESGLAPALAAFLGRFDCPVLPMRYESAELAKIAINCFLAASVSTTNALAEICERIGAHWGEIAPALRLDRRIGQFAYLSPGLGISGGNLERDLATICRIAGASGCDDGVIGAYRRNSEYRKDWVLRRLHEEGLVSGDGTVLAMLGLAYKQDTDSTKNSPAVRLLDDLPHVTVRAYDPAVRAVPGAHARLAHADSPLDACDGADVTVLMTPWEAFRALVPAELAARMRGSTVVDPFGLLEPQACLDAGLRQISLGVPGDVGRRLAGVGEC